MKNKIRYITYVLRTKDFKMWAFRWRDKHVYVFKKKEEKGTVWYGTKYGTKILILI